MKLVRAMVVGTFVIITCYLCTYSNFFSRLSAQTSERVLQAEAHDSVGASSRVGPGIPSIDFSNNDVGRILSQNRVGKAISGVVMHNGYLLAPMGADHGGGGGNGAFAIFDISDPTTPNLLLDSRSDRERYHRSGRLDYVGDWAEIHSLPISDNKMIISEKANRAGGFVIFDMGEFPEQLPHTISRVRFPDVNNANNYNGYSFSLALLGDRYVYAPTGTNGLFIYDIQDPANPLLLRHMTGDQLGSQTQRSAVIIGHWLILSPAIVRANGNVVIFDISDPINPTAIGSFDAQLGYQGWVCGSEFFTGADGPLVSYDFQDPANIQRKVYNNNAQDSLRNPEYGFCQDQNVFIGHYPGLTKWNLSAPNAPLVATASPTNPAADDYAFLTPIGNMAVIASDHNHNNNWNIAVHQANADRNPPSVDFVLPIDGSTNNSVGSKIGISFSDFPDALTLSSQTIQVRPVLANGTLGVPISGSFSQLFGVANFLPDQELQPDMTYQVILLAGGVRDWAGNAIADELVISTFSTGAMIDEARVPQLDPISDVLIGQATQFSVDPQEVSATYAWNFGDGTPQTAFSSQTSIEHTYTAPGNYQVTLYIRQDTEQLQQFGEASVTNPLAQVLPVHSSTIVFDEDNNRIWNVNPDNNSVTAIDGTNYQRVFETKIGLSPQSVALVPGNLLWTINKMDATISEIDAATGAVVRTFNLDYGAAPHGLVVDEEAGVAYISLEGKSTIAQVSLSNGQILNQLPVRAWPRHLALDRQNAHLFVAHFISDDTQGTITALDTESLQFVQEIEFGFSMGPDVVDNGRGLPNYLGALALSPDLTQGFVPSKKDNIQRGTRLDGLELTFEHTVRSMAAQFDPQNLRENVANRLDFDNSDFATAAIYSPSGNRIYVTTSGSESVWVVDAYDVNQKVLQRAGGLAPRGLAMNADGSKLFVHNFMSRNITVFDVEGPNLRLARNVATVTDEALAPVILQGKQLFYNSVDTRLMQEGYMSCASCHLDGGHDGRVWDFSNFGEGFRNTISLQGRGGPSHGPLHWTANFDEVHDFEIQIRGLNRGTGLMRDTDFNQTSDPFGPSKAGYSTELDALAAYVNSLTRFGASPHRNADGTVTAAGQAGKELFRSQNCAECHSGQTFTDSASNRLHDVGTLWPTSGSRMNETLTGLDTPTLRGLWATAPYLHDGSAATVGDAIQAHDHVTLEDTELNQLAAYLNQIDDRESTAPGSSLPASNRRYARYVRFVAESEINGRPWASAAEFDVLDAHGNPINRTAWTIEADSEELVAENAAAINAIDGNPNTMWHTEWRASDPPYPHEIIIDMGSNYEVSGFRYQPRTDHVNGTIADYKFYVSIDGVAWGSPTAQGTFASNNSQKTVELFISGDVNCDNQRNAIDALLILQYDVGARLASDGCEANMNDKLFVPACDVSGESRCGAVDALFILQCDVGSTNVLCP